VYSPENGGISPGEASGEFAKTHNTPNYEYRSIMYLDELTSSGESQSFGDVFLLVLKLSFRDCDSYRQFICAQYKSVRRCYHWMIKARYHLMSTYNSL